MGSLQGTQPAQIPGVGLTDSGSCRGWGGAVPTLDLCRGSGGPAPPEGLPPYARAHWNCEVL